MGVPLLPRLSRKWKRNLTRVLRDGVRPLPPRKDLIQLAGCAHAVSGNARQDWWIGTVCAQSKFRFLIDPMHGAGRGLLRELFRRNGIECDEIRGTRDPLFGGVNPEPIEPHVEALRAAMREGKLRCRIRA